MSNFEGRLLNLDSVDACNRKWSKNCEILFPKKVPVMYDFQHNSSPLGISEVFKDDYGLRCTVTLFEDIPIDECYVGGYYCSIEHHFEGSIDVIDSCRLKSMSVVPDDKVADRNLKIRRVTNNG